MNRTDRPSLAPTTSSSRGMSSRSHWGFGIDDLTRLLGDSKRYEVFNFRVRAVAGENAVKPGTLVKRLGVGERLPLVNTASDAVLTPDELLADKSLFLRKSKWKCARHSVLPIVAGSL